MAEQRIVWVKEIEWKKDKQDRDFSKVTLMGENQKTAGYAIYDKDIREVLLEAHENSLAVNVTLEKQANAKFWNVTGAELVKNQLEKKPLKEAAEEMGAEHISTEFNLEDMTEREYWQHKDRITRKSIERQKALEIASTLGGSSDDIIIIAKRYEQYITKGE